MTPEREARILEIAQELEAEGLEATNSAVYARALGHRGDVVSVMRDRRRERGGSVAVADDEEEGDVIETPAVVLAEDLRQLESAYEGWHLALEQIWQQEREGPLDLPTFSRARWLEYQCTENLKRQEQLRPQLAAARLRDALGQAQETHDAWVPVAREKAEAVLQGVAAVARLCAELEAVFDAQQDKLFQFRSTRGEQAFDVQGGREDALQLFLSYFPNDPRARDAYLLLMQHTPTRGRWQDALDQCPRLRPFSSRAISNYLASLAH